jgi:hypothetical protein
VFFTITRLARFVFVNVHVTVSPAPSVTEASGGAVVLEVDDPLPVVVIAHERLVRSQPPGTVSVTDFDPGSISVNDVLAVPATVVSPKLALTPLPEPV